MDSQTPIKPPDASSQVDGQSFAGRKVERKPEAPPKGSKNFKEVSEKPEKAKDNQLGLPSLDVDEENSPQMSIFDMARASSSSSLPATPVAPAPTSLITENFNTATSSTMETVSTPVAPPPTGWISSLTSSPTTITPKKNEFLPRNSYDPDQPDLSYVNPLAANPGSTAPITAEVTSAKPIISSSAARVAMQEVIDQIVSKLYTVSTRDQMDTVVVLKHPPLFEGVTVTITTYKVAPKELNIAFTNLTQAAKYVLDLPENLDMLRQRLSEREVTVHMINTSAQIETQNVLKGVDISQEGTGRRLARDNNAAGEQQQKKQKEER